MRTKLLKTVYQRNNQRELLYLALTAGAIFRLIFIFSNHDLSPDGAHYASLGYHLLHAGQYVSNGSQFPDIVQPPFYPFLLGVFSFVFEPVLAGKLISFLAGMSLIVAVYLFVKRLSQKTFLAEVSALLVSFNPALIYVSARVATEAVYFLLLFVSFACLLFYLKENGSQKLVSCAAFAIGLAYLTRPETVSYLLMMLIILIIWRKKVKGMLIFTGIIVFFVLAYGLFVFSVSGDIKVYPKISFVRVHSQISRHFLNEDEKQHKKTDFKFHLNRVRYSLNSSADELLTNAVFAGQETLPSMVSEKRPADKKIKKFLVFTIGNTFKAIKKFLWGQILPPGYLLFLLIGILKFPWNKNRGLVLYCAFFLLPTFLVIMANVEQRFLYFPGLIMMPMAAYGILKFNEQFSIYIKKLKSEKTIALIAVIFVFLTSVPNYAQTFRTMLKNEYYYSAGHWLNQIVDHQATIAATVPQPIYFAKRRFVVLPFAPLDSLQLYLLRKQVNFILIESKDRLRRPWQLEKNQWPAFLELVAVKRFNNQTMFLLRVKKE